MMPSGVGWGVVAAGGGGGRGRFRFRWDSNRDGYGNLRLGIRFCRRQRRGLRRGGVKGLGEELGNLV